MPLLLPSRYSEPKRYRSRYHVDHSCGVKMRALFDLAPVIADIISAHCPGTSARSEFVAACIREDWDEAKSMIEGMLAEPWVLRGYQETRLREFLDLLQSTDNVHAMATIH